MISFTLPLRLNNTSNKRECWQATARRKKHHRSLGALHTRQALAGLPQVNALLAATGRETIKAPRQVTITRIGKRKLDKHDNLRESAKFLVDGIAEALGVDDGDESAVEWNYAQEKGDYAVRVQID